jgi:hypothetical protein
MASLLVISLLIFNSYANNPADSSGLDVSSVDMDPVSRATHVSLAIRDNAQLQHQALEK